MSVGLGLLLGLLYGIASFVIAAVSLKQKPSTFIAVYFGGMVVRILFALAAVALIFFMLDVNQALFIGSLFGMFMVCLSLEIAWLVRRRSQSA